MALMGGYGVADNLTPGGKLAGYTDGELFRVLRHRVDKEGVCSLAYVPPPTAQLSDDDVQSIIAYLRTLPPVEQAAVSVTN